MNISKISVFSSQFKNNHPVSFSKRNFLTPPNGSFRDELAIKKDYFEDYDFAEEQTRLESMYLKRLDENSNIFAHKATVKELKQMNKDLYIYPELIQKIYTTENIFGNLPSYTLNAKKLKEINKVLTPELFVQIYSHKNKYGDTVMSYFALDEKTKKVINKLIHKYTKDNKYLNKEDSLCLLNNNKIYLNDENTLKLFRLSGRND